MSLRSSRGFTLMELMLTVSIMAILTGLATAGYWGGVTKDPIMRDKAMLRDALWEARNFARNRNACASVEILGTEVVVSGFTQVRCEEPVVGPVTELNRYQLTGLTTVGAFSTGAILYFNQRGGTEESMETTFTLSDPHGSLVNFTIFPAIGQIRIR